MGDFAHVRHWAPGIPAQRIKRTGAGTVHVISRPLDGREVRELLHAQDRFSYTYLFLGEATSARKCYATIAVEPVDADRNRIRIPSRLSPRPGTCRRGAVADMTRSMRGNLKAMKRALGLV